MPYQATIATVAQSLTDVFAAIDACFDLPAECRAYQPLDKGWSIDEILEHITLTNHYLMLVIRRGRDKVLKRAQMQSVTGAESDLEPILHIGDPDTFPWVRPEHMEPTRTQSAQAVRQRMHHQGRECIDILNSMGNGEGSLHRVTMSVQSLGKLDLYQWLYFLAQHAHRHSVEIERILDELWKNQSEC